MFSLRRRRHRYSLLNWKKCDETLSGIKRSASCVRLISDNHFALDISHRRMAVAEDELKRDIVRLQYKVLHQVLISYNLI